MADIRINSLSTTASSTASDDFLAVDGTTNGTRKLNAYSPTFGGNLTVSGTGTSSVAGVLQVGPLSPLNQLDVSKSGTNNRVSVQVASSDNGIQFIEAGGTRYTIGSSFGLVAPGDYFSFNRFSGSAWSEMGRFVSTGNLLLGTTTDGGQKLQVVSGDSYIARFTDGSTASLNIQKSAIVFANAGISAYAAGNYDASSHTFKIQTATALTVTSNGNVLIGTTTDSANGKIQLTSHTTSAGGIGFGTETSVYRAAAGSLVVDHIGGSAPTLNLSANGSIQSRLFFNGTNTFLESYTSHSLILRTNQTTALTLDSSQNATFAGPVTISKAQAAAYTSLTIQNGNGSGYAQLNLISGSNTASINYAPGAFFKISIPSADSFQVSTNNTTALTLDSSQRCILAGALRLNNAYVSGAPTATGYVTLQDSAGNTYKVLVGT